MSTYTKLFTGSRFSIIQFGAIDPRHRQRQMKLILAVAHKQPAKLQILFNS